jgi:uncharacterized protein YjbI with pentapeptide repeats
VIGALLAVLVLLLVIAGPPLFIRASRPDIRTASAADQLKAENDLRGTLVTMLAGAAVVAGTILAALNFDLQRRGQVTERFSKAIDQLGARGANESEKVDIRLGGIYALEQIAGDSKDLHWPVVEVLTAFIREHAKAAVAPQSAPKQSGADQVAVSSHKAAPDIQAALTVLGRRHSERDQGQVDLVEANLQGGDLRRAKLQRAQLRQANLQGANLLEANLQGAILVGAKLQDANLYEANLQGADLHEADLQGAYLHGANLQGAYLHGANLQGAKLRWAELQDAILLQAKLRGAQLQDAELGRANLQGANLYEADLRGANLYEADLRGANLRQADLQAAVGVSQEQVDSAICDEHTKLPPDLILKLQG